MGVYSDHEWFRNYSHLMLTLHYCVLQAPGIILIPGSSSLGKAFTVTLGHSLGDSAGPPTWDVVQLVYELACTLL